MTLPALFHAIRVELGLNQAQMAKLIGITQGTLSKIEKGKQKPDVWAFIHLCRQTSTRKVSDKTFDALCKLIWEGK